ncbi:MAG: dihydropteroate synthase [Gammaproteobacteria bacterium]|nr:dihydropteroate synthase [Gammaproteobacteria bacterium]
MRLTCGPFAVDLSTPVVMGVLNVTPDSFSDGGHWFDPVRAIDRAVEMVEEGAAFIDVGGESTRPGAATVPVDEELRRVIPLVEALAGRLTVPVSIDTRKPEVMRAAIAAGATLVNDIAALGAAGALEAVAGSGAAVCLMHMQGEPRSMQAAPDYHDVVAEVVAYLQDRAAACVAAGIAHERVVLDPGFGFGKLLEHNLDLLAGLDRLAALGFPVMAGLSRKSMIGQVTGRPVGERLAGSVALATLAALGGARIIRAHDVAATVDAVKIAAALAARQGR